MLDEYSGVKELYEVVLKAKVPMRFGDRELEQGEPVLYFENVKMAILSETSKPIMARGGWSNMPHVIWEDRSEVNFSLTEGVMSSISMGILLSAHMLLKPEKEVIMVPKREGPFSLDNDGCLWLEHMPVFPPSKKVFIYEYERDVAQRKVYGEIVDTKVNILGEIIPKVHIKDEYVDLTKSYIVDYYYNYTNEALVYLIQKDRFNGLFTLEGKFYSKDENEGLDYTNLIYMPKVRVVSDINLRLGERADPTTSVFNIVGMPEKTDESNNLIMRIVRLSEDIDANI